jgi:transketolase
MMGIAAGLAAQGKTVFASTFAVFAAGRTYDQVRISIAQPEQNVKIVASHSGISVGEDGISHHAVEDLALMTSFPNFRVIVPADALETEQAIRLAADTQGPFYIRLSRPKTPIVCAEDYVFQLGKAYTIRKGTDVTIMALGLMVASALDAAETLATQGIDCRVLNMASLKPVDEPAIEKAARDTGAIVTAEEHLLHGGLGSAVARVAGERYPVPLEFVALKDTYAQSGKPAELLREYKLTADDIVEAVQKVLERKRELAR